MAILGVEMNDEALTHVYLKKLMDVFGVDHYATRDAVLYLDEQGIPLPF